MTLNPRNLLGPTLGTMTGWYDRDGVVHPHQPDGSLVTTGIYDAVATSKVVQGLALRPLPVVGGRAYTAAADVSELAILTLQWVRGDGSLGELLTGYGNGRAAVSGRAPDDAAGVVVTIWPGVVTTAPNPADPGTMLVRYPAGLRPPGMPFVIAADNTPHATMRISRPILVRSSTDPGPLPDTDADDSVGWRLYSELPELYRIADLDDPTIDRPLWQFIKGATVGADDVRAVAAQIAAGALTDPVRTTDRWVGWLAQALGVTSTGSAAQIRALLVAQAAAPAVGTAAALAAIVRPMLTDTRSVDVYPATTPWVIMVRVRSGELALVGNDPAQLAARLMATGQVPAGFGVQVTTAQQTWGQMDAATPTWGSADGQDWGHVDSRGL